MSTRILAGRYELLDRIGDGGMAVVYKARCRLLNRFVAIKILKPEYIKDVKFIENFRKESQSAASLNHPHIVNVYDVGREGNIHYIVMELIEGRVLSDVIREEAPLDYRRAIEITRQIASALSFAHKNQIVHRDVKPHNILITRDGTAKITDFGIAKALNTATLVGNEGTIMGSVHYFSPEQARGGYVDEKSDIYSLGIVLYEMLTGKVPFDGDNPVSVALMHVNDTMTPPGQLVSGIPPRLEQIVLKATDKIQINRYKSADDMLEALSTLEFVSSIVGDTAVGGFRRQIHNIVEPPASDDGVNEPDRDDPGATEEKGKKGKGKKKMKINKIKLLAVILALICAIPVSVLLGSFIAGMGKEEPVKIPDVVGLSFERAKEELEKAGLEIETGDEVISSEYEVGRIVSQTPEADVEVKKGKTVVVNLSKGSKAGLVPKVVGLDFNSADYKIKEYGFERGQVDTQVSELPKDVVISQDPAEGTEAKPGTLINIVVSTGKEETQAIMPLLKGEDVDKAKNMIEEAGLKLGAEPIYEYNPDVPKNQVLRQSVKAGEVLEKGTAVTIIVSSGTEVLEPVPITLVVDYTQSPNQVFFLTIVQTDEQETKTVCSEEQKIRDDVSETFILYGKGLGTVTVLFDGNVVMKKDLNFNTGEIT